MPEQTTLQHFRLFPTPDTKNFRVIEVVNSQTPGVKYPTEIGTPHPNKKLFPAHRLTQEAPMENKPGWVRRVYACENDGQDDYNYQIKFSGESTDHPIYLRSYLFKRKGYKALAKGKVDPLFEGTETIKPRLVTEELTDSSDADVNKTYVVVNRVYESLPGPALVSSIYEDQLGLRLSTTEQRIVAGSEPAPAPGTDILSQTAAVDLKKSLNFAAIQAQLDAIHMQIPTQESIGLPPQLIGAKIYWGGQASDGYTTVEPQFQSAGWYSGGIISQSYAGSASASATVDGDLSFEIRDGFKGSAAATLHIFFLPLTATGNDILTKVGAVAWPIFRLTSRNVVLFGRHRSLDVSGKIVVSSLVQVGEDPITFVTTTKTGERRSGGLSTKSIPIPGVLCEGISITEEGDSSVTAEATIKRAAPVLSIYDSTGTIIPLPTINYDYGNWPSDELTVEVEADGTYSPSSIAATTPPKFPTGTYLISSKASLFKYDRLQVTAITVDVSADMV